MSEFQLRKAKVADVPKIYELISKVAERGKVLRRPMSEIYERVRDFFIVCRNDEVIGCVSLHVCWSDLAEIRALAVDEQHNGDISIALVKACISEARALGVSRVFCLACDTDLFKQLGFHRVDLVALPQKAWGECLRCPKYPNDCDETAMVLEIGSSVAKAV